ncbi:unnamed protein product [Calicophoron daubneyi]|uniref:Fork-head domain-containing protein n=1 Tax=Calicophoron daubneyi TaxID=300641 RepID=A0AAV2TJA1_CALDB
MPGFTSCFTAEMSEQTSDFLAKKLRRNWLTRSREKPTQSQEQDDSLTNLNWLQNVNLTKLASSGEPLSPSSDVFPPEAPLGDFFSSQNLGLSSNAPVHHSVKKQYISLFSSGTTHQRPPMLLGGPRTLSQSSVRSSNIQRGHTGFERSPSGARLLPNAQSVVYRSGVTSVPSNLPGVFKSAHAHFSTPISENLEYLQGNLVNISQSALSSNHCCPANGQVSALPISPSYPYTTVKFHASQLNPSMPYHSEKSYRNHSYRGSYKNGAVASLDPPVAIVRGNSHSLCELSAKDTSVGLVGEIQMRTGSASNCFLPSLLVRHENRSGTHYSSLDTVDISTSGLFISFDSLDIAVRKSYRNDPNSCPPYSFHTLIYMSMQSLKKQKITLNEICSWITDNFAYFRNSPNNWQGALRQDLVASRCFQRVPRRKEEPRGRDDLWRLNPEFQVQLNNQKISQKFLSCWQNGSCSTQSEVFDLPGNKYQIDPRIQNSYPTSEASNLLRRFTSLDSLNSRADCISDVTSKRRRTGSSEKLRVECNVQQSGASSLNDTASCSASSSSPPLSDLYTPPPHLVPESSSLSPYSFIQTKDLFGNLDEAELGATSVGDDLNNVQLDSLETPPVLTQDGVVNFADNTDNNHQTVNQLQNCKECPVNSSRSSVDDQLLDIHGVELSKAFEIHGISPADLTSVGDPVDLTIRGVGLKPGADWWTSGLSESVSSFFNDTFEPNEVQDLNKSGHPSEVDLTTASGVNSDNSKTTEACGDISEYDSDTSSAALTSGLSRYPILPGSPFSLEHEQQWVDEQLNLEELDSILGLS